LYMTPPLKTDPKYGYYPHWPQDGNDWLHSADIELARTLIPSPRIFRRDGTDGEFNVLHYGEITLRVLPALWQEVEPEGFEIGDWVEVLSRGMTNERRTGTIREMLWDDGARSIRYQISENGRPIDDLYSRDDLQHVEPL